MPHLQPKEQLVLVSISKNCQFSFWLVRIKLEVDLIFRTETGNGTWFYWTFYWTTRLFLLCYIVHLPFRISRKTSFVLIEHLQFRSLWNCDLTLVNVKMLVLGIYPVVLKLFTEVCLLTRKHVIYSNIAVYHN